MTAPVRFDAATARPAPAAAGVDNKEWARRILAREARGDKRLLPIQVRFAREALGMRAEVAA